jgi:hypothetical protein
MAALPDLDRNPFENLCKGIHDFNEVELARLHKAAEEVKGIVKSANERQEKSMMARNQLRQMG